MATPTQAQLDAAFTAAKKEVDNMIDLMVGSWAESQVSDDEIRSISSAAVQAAFSVEESAPASDLTSTSGG